MNHSLDIVILGLTITSSWGNGHATTYRGLVKGLAARGHRVTFLEREAEWYSSNRDEPNPQGATVAIYKSLEQLRWKFEATIKNASLVIVGSYVPQGKELGEWVLSVARGKCAFYDIDTPVTLSLLEAGQADYISASLMRRYHVYLSFTGGPLLRTIENAYGAPMARALYCAVDQEIYRPVSPAGEWDLGYLGTYSADRQSSLDQFLLEPARCWKDGRFAVVGPQYPEDIAWPHNVERATHLSPREHPAFYASQRFTLNITREAMKAAGYSPSVRLFEAAACGAPVISDWWEGLDYIFTPGREVLIAETTDDVLRFLRDFDPNHAKELGSRARQRVLAEHSPVARAIQVEAVVAEMNDNVAPCLVRRDQPERRVQSIQ